MSPRQGKARRALLTGVLALTVSLVVPLTAGAAVPAQPPPPEFETSYSVAGADTPEQRTAIAARDIDILTAGPGRLEIRATRAEADALRAEGLTLTALPPAPGTTLAPVPNAPADFPAGYSGYTNYAELGTRLTALRNRNPAIVSLSNYGTSYQGRSLPLIKISDNVGTDENEPEVLFTCAQHAREHLTVEMCLRIAERLVANYGSSTAGQVNSREIWVMPMLNPDGAEYDIAAGTLRSWRKNRQPNAGTTAVGTDPNRNWGYGWGCCGGSSGSPGSDTYRGTSAFSAPETARVRDWVNGRVVGGRQQITAHIDWHTYSELILWPYGYTTADTATGLSSADAATFASLGRAMGQTNGYTPQQASDLYIADGGMSDWMWAAHRIWSYTFEMYPTSQTQGGFYPRDSVIARETARNDAAVDLFVSYADCPPRVTGRTC
ncbi:MAG: Carboxypeptidase T [uncultured Pseudonocardia sp.]|uniref:Zinc carboxypeptidase n=1 Tax=uncultured Pseudonocardia sp. TaxID=211455 RepID=A0A6J4NBK9_9PSEU|nr:MAG: Carboxypeptidase T [uncultured Pseudonocardia sp.]